MITETVRRSVLKELKRQRAFTLVEVIVVVALAALFSTIVFRMFSSSSSSQKTAMVDLTMQSRVLTSQNRIVRMIREGTDFLLPEIGETSSALFFADFKGNVQVLYQLKDAALSKSLGKEVYKLMHYKVAVKNFDLSNPVYDPNESSVVAEYVNDISFMVSNANTVSITASFATENRDFQAMFEVGLQNTGEME
ncbi:MAG: hypothetical protein A2W80_08925 [Candidatus Riflebacteria bacterium GWC2_50_8]|nr:MAG: hypothetical protein A2W80_08925 [Candidatus Riflebacteria bacterium GWC2_50_8]